MGCAASTAREEPLADAAPVQPGAGTGEKRAAAPAPISALQEGKVAEGGDAPPAVTAAAPAVVPSDEQAAVVAASVAAERAYAPAPSPSSLLLLEIDTSALDTISSEYVGDADLTSVVNHLSSEQCRLFAGAPNDTLEITPQSLAELILIAGGANEAVSLLQHMDAAQVRCKSMAQLPAAMEQQLSDEAAAQCATLPADVRAAVLSARAFLARHTCELFPYSAPPKVASTSADSANTSADHDAELELDFSKVNQDLVHTRMRLSFLKPTFIVALVHAGGRSAASEMRPLLSLLLQSLTLQEESFSTPSELLRGVLSHRALSLEAQERLRAEADAQPAASRAVPAELSAQVAPLQKSLVQVEPSCVKLQPLMEPLIPTLSTLSPTMHHLQQFLSRFLPLLQESTTRAQASNTAPEDDKETAQILRAYLIPFLQLMQPWILLIRPYLAGLQPFFESLQPTLVHTHAFFMLLQPFLHQLLAHVQPKPQPFLLDESFSAPLAASVHVLALLHPLLRQLHPLCQGLLSFCAELGTFLAQLQQLLDLLQRYQTLPLEEDDAPERERDNSVSSIAVPWFAAGASRPSTGEAELSAPRFLAKHGRFLGKLAPYVEQLRPFASDIEKFVLQFAPFLAQLAPFYRDSLKSAVTPVLLYIRHDAHAQQSVPAKDKAPSMDDAALQRLLSS